jgi:hypothetical protein
MLSLVYCRRWYRIPYGKFRVATPRPLTCHPSRTREPLRCSRISANAYRAFCTAEVPGGGEKPAPVLPGYAACHAAKYCTNIETPAQTS